MGLPELSMLLMIDNYDSFTYNLVQYFGELGQEVRVFRNDEITLDEIAALAPQYLVLSPGPCSPAEAGICVSAIQRFTGRLPILGVCLGHQAIGAALGGNIICAQRQMHGKASTVSTDQLGVYQNLPEQFRVIRYHSLVIERQSLPAELEVTSTSEDGEIMGVRHRAWVGTATPLEGVQFHPESILSEHGHALLQNFLQMPLGGVHPVAPSSDSAGVH
jgi:anthranilate synthase component II